MIVGGVFDHVRTPVALDVFALLHSGRRKGLCCPVFLVIVSCDFGKGAGVTKAAG